MATKRTKSKYYKEYMKNRRRIQRYINEYKKYGYLDISDILPEIPKKLTKSSVQRLEKITKKTFEKKLEKRELVTEVGELLSGKEAKAEVKEIKSKLKQQKKLAQERMQAGTPQSLPKSTKYQFEIERRPVQPPQQTVVFQDDIVKNFKELIQSLPEERWTSGRVAKNTSSLKSMALRLMDDNLTEYGNEYIKHLMDNEDKVDEAVLGITYASQSETVDLSMRTLIELLNYNNPLTPTQADLLSDFGELTGYNEFSDEYY